MKNSKKNKVLLILILAVILIMALISIKIAVTIPGRDSDGTKNIDITGVNQNDTISVNTNREDSIGNVSGNNIPYVLKDDNTFCMDKSLRMGYYYDKETSKYKYAQYVKYRCDEVKKDVTGVEAYIFYSAIKNRTKDISANNYKDIYQIAYWKHLGNDVSNIQDQQLLNDAGTLLQNANDYYENSKNYAKLGATEKNGKVTLTGSYDLGYKIYKNDEFIAEKKEKTFNLTDINAKNGDDLRIVSSFVKYKASYKKFVSTGVMDGIKTEDKFDQPFLVVTGTEYEDDAVVINDLDIGTDISIQKYISKVNDVELTKDNTELTARENKKAGVGEKWNGYRHVDKISKTVKVSEEDNVTKKFAPVFIEAGDTVEYTITVYNNSDISTNVILRDRLEIPKAETDKSNEENPVGIYDVSYDENGKYYKAYYESYTDGGTDANYTYYNIDTGTNMDGFKLEAGKDKTFKITVKFSKYKKGMLENRAWISSMTYALNNDGSKIYNNNEEYRTFDVDFVQMKKTAVSLEKFVSKVGDNFIDKNGKYVNYIVKENKDSEYTWLDKISENDGYAYKKEIGHLDANGDRLVTIADIRTINEKLANGTTGDLKKDEVLMGDANGDGRISISDARLLTIFISNFRDFRRDDYQYFKDNGEEEENEENRWIYNSDEYLGESFDARSKFNNPVPVEPGDIVTYSIRLTNTGETSIKVTGITDTFNKDYLTLQSIEGNGLVFNSEKPNEVQGGEVTGYQEGEMTIKFTNGTTLESGESASIFEYVILKFKVDLDLEEQQTLIENEEKITNEAKVTKIINKNNIEVEDSDGEENNIDRDFVEIYTKKYAVSLEKFVSNVAIKKNTENIQIAGRENHRYNEYDKSDMTKYNSPVSVEPGDTITYSIRLTNTGETPIKVTKITDTFDKVLEFKGLNGNGVTLAEKPSRNNNGTRTFIFENPISIEGKKSIYLELKFYLNPTVDEQKDLVNGQERITNTAEVTEIINKNGVAVYDSDGIKNNKDSDFVEIYTKKYAVSLEKFVSSGGHTLLTPRVGNAEHCYDDNLNTKSDVKYNSPVTVSQGNRVTYTIKLTNNGTTEVYITNIADYLPDGIKYTGVTYQGGEYNKQTDNKINCDILKDYKIEPGKSKSFGIVVTVIEPNLSLNILKNVAEITNIENENGVEIYDTTQNDNKDADYLQLDYDDDDDGDGEDIILGGTVWNDKALNKLQDNYNGVYNAGDENKLSGIKVQLYRVGKGFIAETTTDKNGEYSFANSDIKKDIVTNSWEQYIKAPKNKNNDRWNDNKEYYSYYVVFEYDGITYTSTPNGTSYEDIINSSKNYKLDSNAREDYGKVEEKRSDFNKKISPINNESGISYTTKNEGEYIPQSNHIYKAEKMAMQSSTQLIDFNSILNGKDIESINDIQDKIKYIGLGLRGRDIFDLELTSDVYSTKVTVNGVDGEYSYNNNKVTVRKSDIPVAEDAANFANEARSATVSEVNKNLRKTDIKNNAYDVNGDGTKGDTGLHIEVTYKITVKNESATDGTATRIVDYYDSKYSFVKAYNGNGTLSTSEGDSGTGFKSVVITTPGTNLTQSGTMEIYVVLKLNNASATLSSLLTGTDKISTYNMAEIYEYKTQCAKGQTEYTRGLIDKDSAPGSANKEQVRTKNTVNQNTSTTGGNPTTIGYYFGGNDLSKLKYEDDTYATPTLYFVSSENQRTINGTVFRDTTKTDPTTKIKTGNGKLDKGEVGVYGATVELVELKTEESPGEISDNSGIVRVTIDTDKNGNYTLSGFLPGNYVIRYRYGNTTKTVLLHQSDNKNENEYSFNGEDYQSTNNIGTYGAAKLNNTNNYWYLYNENDRISTATDNKGRRNQVSEAVTNFTDDQMILLNKIRAGIVTEIKQDDTEGNKIIEQTKMYAHTPNMLFKVEKPEVINGTIKETQRFKEYIIDGMNFGIAEVPVTTIDLQKRIKEFSITDAIGQNVLASGKYVNGRWEHTGFVDTLGTGNVTKGYSAQIEDQKLQGAKLQITYSIKSGISVERNFDATGNVQPTLKGLVDFVDNDLSYNASLGDNSKYWELVTDRTNMFSSGAKGTVDPDGTKYTEVVKVKDDNPLLETYGGETTITLEKVLSSTDSTIEDIIESEVDPYEYSNIVEITEIDYTNINGSDTPPQEDRIRTPKTDDVNTSWMIIREGIQHDTAISDTLSIIPPTGTTQISTVYYVIAAVSLVILAVGAFGIKKFIVKK